MAGDSRSGEAPFSLTTAGLYKRPCTAALCVRPLGHTLAEWGAGEQLVRDLFLEVFGATSMGSCVLCCLFKGSCFRSSLKHTSLPLRSEDRSVSCTG